MNTIAYHPDTEINAEIEREANENEILNLKAGYPVSWWRCPCGASHQRGWFGAEGNHRCLKCGYTGPGGIMAPTRAELYQEGEE